jgi:hypothetical protein
MEELRRERDGAQAAESELEQDARMQRGRNSIRWPPSEVGEGRGRVRQSGPTRS